MAGDGAGRQEGGQKWGAGGVTGRRTGGTRATLERKRRDGLQGWRGFCLGVSRLSEPSSVFAQNSNSNSFLSGIFYAVIFYRQAGAVILKVSGNFGRQCEHSKTDFLLVL